MADLRLTCLGDFQAVVAGAPLVAFPTDKVRALLVYLAVEPREHQRSELAQFFWPGYSDTSARNSLRQALYQLRQLQPDPSADAPWFLLTRQTVQFNPAAAVSVDVTTFANLLAECATHPHPQRNACQPCQARLQQAVNLYQGDFLASFTVADSDPFEEWRRIIQEQLHIQMFDALTRLADAAETAGESAAALQVTQRQLLLEPWREATHRRIMHLLAQRGQRAAALAQYQRCRQVLAEAWGVEPDAETSALYEEIQRGDFDRVTSDRVTNDRVAERAARASTAGRAVTLSPPQPVTPAPLRDWTEMPAVDFFCRTACRGGAVDKLVAAGSSG